MMHKDKIVIAGIINGDERILKGFYKDHIRYIQGYILKNSGNAEDVEDVFQDALVILYQKLRAGLVEKKSSVKTYFYSICKNLWRNRLRKKRELTIDECRMDVREGMHESIIKDIESNEREHLYRKHFQKLSVDNKDVLHHFFDGKSIRDIAEIMGYTEKYTRKKKFEAKRQLVTMIEEDPIYEELKEATSILEY